MFVPATKLESRLRLGLCGTSGSGKTYTALAIATALGGKVAVVDTEHGSAAKYSDTFAFDVLNLTSFEAEKFTAAIRAAESAGYTSIVLDSLSHAWMGTGGTLDKVTEAKRRSTNEFTAWRDPSKQHTDLIEAILHARLHVIATMRSKTEYVLEEDPRTGKKVPKKVGMAPVQRDGMEYEFDVVGDMQAGVLVISKTRCPALADKSFHHPGAEFAGVLTQWLTGAVAPVQPAAPTGPSQEATAAFAAACAAASRDPRTESAAMIQYYGAANWAHLTDSDLAAYPSTWAVEPAAPTPLTPIVTASHPDFIRFRTACEFAGVDHGQAMIALLTEHDTTEVGALPAGALIKRASEIETAAMPAASGFQV